MILSHFGVIFDDFESFLKNLQNITQNHQIMVDLMDLKPYSNTSYALKNVEVPPNYAQTFESNSIAVSDANFTGFRPPPFTPTYVGPLVSPWGVEFRFNA